MTYVQLELNDKNLKKYQLSHWTCIHYVIKVKLMYKKVENIKLRIKIKHPVKGQNSQFLQKNHK